PTPAAPTLVPLRPNLAHSASSNGALSRGEAALNHASVKWTDDDAFTVGGESFRIGDPFRPLALRRQPDEFLLLQPWYIVEKYVELLSELRPRNVFELGIHEGGSTVLYATLAELR